jgi:hypothetical protein
MARPQIEARGAARLTVIRIAAGRLYGGAARLAS